MSVCREAACRAPLAAADRADALAREAMATASSLRDQWRSLEGELRVLDALQARERERLRTFVLAERAEAYRRASSQPVAERLAIRRAQRELRVVGAALAEITRVEAIKVHEVHHTDGLVSLEVLDTTEPEKTAALARPEEQEKILLHLSAYLGEDDEERIYVVRAKRLVIEVSYSNGKVNEPATRLVLGIRRPKRPSQSPTSVLLGEIVAMRERKAFANQLGGLSSEQVLTFSVTQPTESSVNGPTLVQLREEAEAERARVEEYLHDLSARKAAGKAAKRTQEGVDGAYENLLRLGALHTVGIDSSAAAIADEHDEAKSDADRGGVASLFAEGCDLGAADQHAEEERRNKAERRQTREALCAAEGRELLLRRLHERGAPHASARAPSAASTMAARRRAQNRRPRKWR